MFDEEAVSSIRMAEGVSEDKLVELDMVGFRNRTGFVEFDLMKLVDVVEDARELWDDELESSVRSMLEEYIESASYTDGVPEVADEPSLFLTLSTRVDE